MIFISYRREDSKAVVTNLHARLVARFGAEQVFIDYNDIPPGEKWPDTLRQKLEESRVLLAVIGSQWGDARFSSGKKKGRLRLDDPDDWVRQEICTAVRRGKDNVRVIVVPIDGTPLPDTEWGCELDQLPTLQHARLRHQADFERDFLDLCEWLKKQIPELRQVADSDRLGAAARPSPAGTHRALPRQAANVLETWARFTDAVMWALCWLTGAYMRARGNNLSEPEKPSPLAKFVLLDVARIQKVEEILQHAPALPGYLVLTRQQGVSPVVHQFDWMIELARIADGFSTRRLLPLPGLTGRSASTDWLRELLNKDLPARTLRRIALTLGSFGIYVPAMVQPLRSQFGDYRKDQDASDEALVYLGLIKTSEVIAALVEAADTPPLAEDDDYLYSGGLFGLLLVDNVDVLAAQIRKAMPHSDLNAYAYGLAGSCDPRGKVLLAELKDHENAQIRTAVAKALARPWVE